MAGKGDTPRPLSISKEEFGEKIDNIDWFAAAREAATEPGFLMLKHIKCRKPAFQYREEYYLADMQPSSAEARKPDGSPVAPGELRRCYGCGEVLPNNMGSVLVPSPRKSNE